MSAVRVARLWGVLLACMVLLPGCGASSHMGPVQAASESPQAVTLGINLAVSPDGRFVAFDYHRGKHMGVGLLEWRTGKLTRIPSAEGTWLHSPAFSSDGTRLAVAITSDDVASEIAIVDLATMAVRQITTSVPETRFNSPRKRVKINPVFQPDDKNILFVEYDSYPNNRQHVSIVNVETGVESNIFSEGRGFYYIFQPFFTKKNEFYFDAISPVNKEMISNVNAFWGEYSMGIESSYRASLDGKIDIAFPELQKKMRGNSHHSNINSLTGSKNGEVIVFVGAVDPNPKGFFDHEIYRYETDGAATRLTNVNSHLADVRISGDGSVVAFLSDPSRREIFDLCVLNMRDGRVFDTHLAQSLSVNPDFGK